MGETVSGIIGAFKGPGESPMMEQAAPASGFTPVATQQPDMSRMMAALGGGDKGIATDAGRNYGGAPPAPQRLPNREPALVPEGATDAARAAARGNFGGAPRDASGLFGPSGTLATPPSSTPAGLSSSEAARNANRPAAPDRPQDQDKDALWKQIAQGVNIANSTAQFARGLRGDLTQGGPPASPLMPKSVGGGMPYQPTARNRPMTLSELLARR